MNLDQLFELDRLAKEDSRKYVKKRAIYHDITGDSGAHFLGIVGPRGVGKTVILKQLALTNERSFYVSLDAMEGSLFDLVKTLYETMRMKVFLLDEVHFYPSFEADLKKIYDYFDIKVIFTSSVALGMYESDYDLSRRVLLKNLYPFSLGEYAFFKYGQEYPVLTIHDIVKKNIPVEALKAGEHFIPYLKGGLMPFALEEPRPLPLLRNILNTIIYKDIPRIGRLLTEELDKIDRLVRFIGLSGIDGINASSLAANVHITKYKAEQYLTLLERAFVLHRVMPMGSNVLKEPKIVMALPYRLLFRPFDEIVGGLREDFFVEAVKALGKDIFYLKSTRGRKTPDYLICDFEDVVFEIGGKGKGRSQFKGIGVHNKVILSDGYEMRDIRRPLFLMGLVQKSDRHY